MAPSDVTVRAFVERTWLPALATSGLRPTTVELYRRTTERYVLPALGSLKLREVTPSHLVRWLTGLKEQGTGARTVELAGVTCHKILAAALDHELISRNPADNGAVRAARGHAKAAEPTVWSPEQTAAFLRSQEGDRLYALWRLVAATGLRRGELAGLCWSAVDLEAGTLVVSATRVVVGHKVMASGPKTDAGARTVSLDSATVAALRQHRRRQLEERVAAGPAWEGDGELLFVDELGRPIHPARMTKLLAARARAAGLPPIHLHALRHGHATHGLQGGVPLAVMSKRLGHSSIRITADIYSHLVPELDRAAADQVAALPDGAGRQTS